MAKYTVKVLIDIFVTVEAESEEEAEDFVRNEDDAELWAIADQIDREYEVLTDFD